VGDEIKQGRAELFSCGVDVGDCGCVIVTAQPDRRWAAPAVATDAVSASATMIT